MTRVDCVRQSVYVHAHTCQCKCVRGSAISSRPIYEAKVDRHREGERTLELCDSVIASL